MKPLLLRTRPREPGGAEVEAILRQRAERMRRRRVVEAEIDEAAAADRFWVARIRVAGEAYALPLEQVRAAMPLRMVSPVPLAPSYVLGILRFRGEPVVAMSLVSLLGVRGWQVDPAVLIVVETAVRRLALDCEEVPQAAAIPLAAVEEARRTSIGAPILPLEPQPGTKLFLIDDLEALIRSPSEAPGAR